MWCDEARLSRPSAILGPSLQLGRFHRLAHLAALLVGLLRRRRRRACVGSHKAHIVTHNILVTAPRDKPPLPWLSGSAAAEASTEELSMGCTFGRAPPT